MPSDAALQDEKAFQTSYSGKKMGYETLRTGAGFMTTKNVVDSGVMSAGSHIRAVGPREAGPNQAEAGSQDEEHSLVINEHYEEVPDLDEPAAEVRSGRIAPAIALVAIAAWTLFFVWSHASVIRGGVTPQAWSGLIADWTMPVILVVALWLLAMRTSRREAARFTDAAHALSVESAQLEQRLSTVNRELSLAREFIGAQSRELDSLGRIAAGRLSDHADRLQGLIHENGAQVDRIADVSASALENMDRLRDDLPVIAQSARDVSNQIGNAGRTAHAHIEEMGRGFERINDFGIAGEKQIGVLRDEVEATLSALEAQMAHFDDMTTTRFAAIAEKSVSFRAELDGREVDALAAMRHRADRLREEIGTARAELDGQEAEILKSLQARLNAIRDGAATIGRSLVNAEESATGRWSERLGQFDTEVRRVSEELEVVNADACERARERFSAIRDEGGELDRQLSSSHQRFLEELAARRDELKLHGAEAAEVLEAQLAAFDSSLAERREEQIAQAAMLAEHGDAIATRLDELGPVLDRITAHGRDTGENLVAQIAALSGRLEESRAALNETDGAVAELTQASSRLLEIIQAAARHSGTDLPEAIDIAQSRLADVDERTGALRTMLHETTSEGEKLAHHVLAAREMGRQTIADIDEFDDRFATAQDEHAARLEALHGRLCDLRKETEAISARAQGELRDAIATLEESARNAVATIESGSAQSLRGVATRIGDEATVALERALRSRTETAIEEVEAAASRASDAGREATIQLRDQLTRVNELAGNLEARVARARATAEEEVDNHFSRRVALITESLNSNAIDISKAFSAEVSDTAWASYLRGDRGIFTRRAVRLLDNAEMREIAELYRNDNEFREHVSRYIHDFEGMLRAMLSTRDGNALAVTLLSSDMGKLYVALAQAIERLRA